MTALTIDPKLISNTNVIAGICRQFTMFHAVTYDEIVTTADEIQKSYSMLTALDVVDIVGEALALESERGISWKILAKDIAKVRSIYRALYAS